MRSVVRIPGEATPKHRAPDLGEHTDEVLRNVAGYSAKEIAALRQAGVV